MDQGQGPWGVTAGVQPKASAANSSELIAYLQHQPVFDKRWRDVAPTDLAYGHGPVDERMDFI